MGNVGQLNRNWRGTAKVSAKFVTRKRVNQHANEIRHKGSERQRKKRQKGRKPQGARPEYIKRNEELVDLGGGKDVKDTRRSHI